MLPDGGSSSTPLGMIAAESARSEEVCKNKPFPHTSARRTSGACAIAPLNRQPAMTQIAW
jgi:hypothetical protein